MSDFSADKLERLYGDPELASVQDISTCQYIAARQHAESVLGNWIHRAEDAERRCDSLRVALCLAVAYGSIMTGLWWRK